MTTPAPAPGRGAAVIEPPRGSYVYVVRSRRSGAISIGIDLTPEGACPLACDYCQVSGPRHRTPALDADLVDLSRELDDALARHPEAADITFAGSGEPTWSARFRAAFALALDAARSRKLRVVVYTSGALFGRANVREPLAAAVLSGAADVWVKLDTWDEESMMRIAGSRGQALHEERILALAREAPIGTQTLVVHRPDGWSVGDTARGLSSTLERLLDRGARIGRAQLTTLLRPPGAGGQLRPYDRDELAVVAAAFGAVGVQVRVVGDG